MIKSLDLFSGIGGMTLALKGIADPLAYCEVSSEPQKCLLKNMKLGNLPKAPISTDIKTLDKDWLRKNKIRRRDIQMLVGGFPCQGMSLVGLQNGFDHEQSKLFYELLRVADLTKCPLLFLENVANIISIGMKSIIKELCQKRGYELRWIVISAESVGALHLRKRWFCLAIKPGFTFTLQKASHYIPFEWSLGSAPPRATIKPLPDNSKRLKMLGNSLVPDVARRAFIILANNFENANLDIYSVSRGFTLYSTVYSTKWNTKKLVSSSSSSSSSSSKKKKKIPTIGIAYALHALHIINLKNRVKLTSHHDLKLVLDPKSFKSNKPKSQTLTNPLIKTPLMIRLWATPRANMTHPCNYLTTRTVRDLPNQIRFATSTPEKLRPGKTNADFVEWLMGYPKGWTDSAKG